LFDCFWFHDARFSDLWCTFSLLREGGEGGEGGRREVV
jgi:hypothetical protein